MLSLPSPPQVSDVWCTSAQFLRLGYGDWEEHAVLLANYYLWWDARNAPQYQAAGAVWETYLLLGTAIPDGDVVYVLRVGRARGKVREEVLVDPKTGQHYTLPRDADLLPLRQVGSLVGAENVWANVQPREAPAELQYDVGSAQHWAPLFRPGGLTRAGFERMAGQRLVPLQRPLGAVYEASPLATRARV